jgi:hypothetical protein
VIPVSVCVWRGSGAREDDRVLSFLGGWEVPMIGS